jgi:hypothetical protein
MASNMDREWTYDPDEFISQDEEDSDIARQEEGPVENARS